MQFTLTQDVLDRAKQHAYNAKLLRKHNRYYAVETEMARGRVALKRSMHVQGVSDDVAHHVARSFMRKHSK